MKVYRFMCKEELDKILCDKVSELGAYFRTGHVGNNHKYKANEKYMHFFLNKNAYKHFTKTKKDDHYLCVFDIPISVLLTHAGKGIYRGLRVEDRGYDALDAFRKRVEFAVETSVFKSSWLKAYKKIEFEEEKKIASK